MEGWVICLAARTMALITVSSDITITGTGYG